MAITVTTLVLLIVSTVIVLTRLDVWPTTSVTTEPAWLRRCWLAAAIVAPAVIYLEPIRANFDFGQINVVLMTLVIADCVPRRTPWPRGMLLGVAIALKLTPAVFLLYFVLRRDARALVVTASSAVVATLIGFVLAWRDSWEYWTDTVRNTDRIGTATLNTNQNIAGTLARLGLGEGARFVLWTLLCFVVLGVTIWAVRRVLRADEPMLALICVAMFGLVVSPVSWSHHWVWALPTVLVCAVVAYRRRNAAARRGHRGRRGADGVDADRADARTPRDDGVAVASARWRFLRVVGARGDRGRRDGGGRFGRATARGGQRCRAGARY